MSTFVLKLIACVAMLIDHVTATFADSTGMWWTVGLGIGRLAFPIFCFLVVEGFFHTRNRKKYALRLLLAALLSEIPYDCMRFGTVWNFDSQNVMWTLLLGFLAIAMIEYVKTRYPGDMMKYNTFSCLAILLCGVVAMFFATDYTVFGVALIVSFYMFRGRKLSGFLMFAVLVWLFYSANTIQFASLLAYPVLLFYNGKKGMDDRYCLYAFYPVHMLIIGLIARFVL